MELEELRIVLQQEAQKQAPASEKTIALMLRQKTTGTIHYLKKSLLFEILAAIGFLIITILSIKFIPGKFILFTGIISISYTLFFLNYLVYLFIKVKQFGQQLLPTLTYLKDIIHLLTRFTNLFFWLCMLFPPAMFLLSLAFLLQYHPGFYNHPVALFQSGVFRVLIAAFLVWGIFMYKFSHWYINNGFGRYIAILNGLVQELTNP